MVVVVVNTAGESRELLRLQVFLLQISSALAPSAVVQWCVCVCVCVLLWHPVVYNQVGDFVLLCCLLWCCCIAAHIVA
jgi:hypothetical protein